jgi:hypothetical protein
MRRGLLSLVGGLALLPAPSAQGAGAPHRAEIRVLRTYPMGNPGLDAFNLEADDVRSAKRHAETEARVDVLPRFEPTAIAVIRSKGPRRTSAARFRPAARA